MYHDNELNDEPRSYAPHPSSANVNGYENQIKSLKSHIDFLTNQLNVTQNQLKMSQNLSQSLTQIMQNMSGNNTKPTSTTECITTQPRSNSIQSYFPCKSSSPSPTITSSSDLSQPQSSPSPETNKFKITSTNIKTMVKHEGKDIFKLTKSKQTTIEIGSQCQAQKLFKLICIPCNQTWSKSNTNKSCHYIHGLNITQQQLYSNSYLRTVKKGIMKHVNNTFVHSFAINQSSENVKFERPLDVKIQSMFTCLQRSSVRALFAEFMVLFDQINYQRADSDAVSIIDIGDKQHGTSEYRRIFTCFKHVVKKQKVYIIHNSLYYQPDFNVVLVAGVIDGWSRGKLYMFYCLCDFALF